MTYGLTGTPESDNAKEPPTTGSAAPNLSKLWGGVYNFMVRTPGPLWGVLTI